MLLNWKQTGKDSATAEDFPGFFTTLITSAHKKAKKHPAWQKKEKKNRILCKTCCPLPSSSPNSTPGHIYQARDGLSTFWRQTSVYPPSNPKLIGADTAEREVSSCQRPSSMSNPKPYLKCSCAP
ncbi:hypothetical protein NPIL_259611 [Nephila pilipes]|uniref:Uncharacterized protein n=1 Tax=Nephila pilipes TaxID=299642 RepID=A0A8X6QQA9_NEPPI|nr:hypothetical protein NPIL_259611 [Nephila pilipes]